MRVLRELALLLRLVGFRRLFSVRVASQCADGLFQVGLATLFFFSPERQNSAGQVAVAFAVLLLPFTVVGPWAGVFLDRWRRRQVLLFGNLVRAVLAGLIAVLMFLTPAGQGLGWPVYVLALAVLSVNRFLLSALSAGLPLVVEGRLLLTANSLIPTLGGVAAGFGAVMGFVIGVVLPVGRLQDAGAVVVGGVMMLVASGLALRLGADQLGPDAGSGGASVSRALAGVAGELVAGARYLWRRRTPGQALLIMSFHRFLFGVTLVASILISRNFLADPLDAAAGMAVFGKVAAATGLGFALAIVLTPLVSPIVGAHRWIWLCLLLGAVSLVVLAVQVSLVSMCVTGVLLGLSAQGAKIAVDTVVQRDTADPFRGRAFALYDVLYNAGFVGSAALAAVALPDDGVSVGLFVGVALAYLVAAGVFGGLGAQVPGVADDCNRA